MRRAIIAFLPIFVLAGLLSTAGSAGAKPAPTPTPVPEHDDDDCHEHPGLICKILGLVRQCHPAPCPTPSPPPSRRR